MGINKKIFRIAVFILIFNIMPRHTAYASESSSRLQASGPAAVSQTGDADSDMSGQETPVSAGQNKGAQQKNASDQNAGVQQTETSDQNTGGQTSDVSDQNTDGQQTGASGQEENVQQTDTADQGSDGLQNSEDQAGQNQDEIQDEIQDEDQEDFEDDDDWEDGDDEWTEAWTGADDEMQDDWAEDETEDDEAETGSEDIIDSYDTGAQEYIAKSTVPYTSSSGHQDQLDQNYKTGAGLGSDLLLILAVVCGMAAVGFAVRKSMHTE